MTRWDWYSSTVHGAGIEEVLGVVLAAPDEVGRPMGATCDVAPGRPMNGYDRAVEVRRGETRICTVLWGGVTGVHVVASGERSPWLAEVLQGSGMDHRPTRVDACLDWIEAGLFDRMAGELLPFAEEAGLTIHQRGDWARGLARTLYIGSPKSTVRLVLYEKGYEADSDPRWVRLEVRVRPKGPARLAVAQWAPRDAWSACRWLTQALERLGWSEMVPQSVGTVWRPSDAQRARRQMIRQYHRILQGWADELGGWDALGAELRDQVHAVQREGKVRVSS